MCVTAGCNAEMMGCIERFAFQHLLHGGFTRNAIPSEVVGLLPEEVNKFLTAPYLSLPRFDAGVHLRAQTSQLEKNVARNHSQFALDMKEYQTVFQVFERTLSHHFFVKHPVMFNVSNAALTGAWPRIFISCDDVDVRDAFVAVLLNRTDDIGRFIPVFVNASHIKHVKHISFEHSIPDQGLVNTAFDWYALSLSQVIYAWRLRYVSIVSTFMDSATRVSMVKPTAKDFKAAILHKNLKFIPNFGFIDGINATRESI